MLIEFVLTYDEHSFPRVRYALAGRKEYDINWDKESGNGCVLPDIWSVG
jgi:hypothetical protein